MRSTHVRSSITIFNMEENALQQFKNPKTIMGLLKHMFNLAEDSKVEQYVILDSEFFGLYLKGRGERPAHLLYEISYIVINASGISSYSYYFQDLVLDGKVLVESQVCYGKGAFRQLNKERLDENKPCPYIYPIKSYRLARIQNTKMCTYFFMFKLWFLMLFPYYLVRCTYHVNLV